MYPDPSTNISRFAIASPFQGLFEIVAIVRQAMTQRTVEFSTHARRLCFGLWHESAKTKRTAIFALIPILTTLHWQTTTVEAQQLCTVKSVTFLMPGDERLIQFNNCGAGIVANLHWTAEADVPPVIPQIDRQARLDPYSWIIPQETWLLEQMNRQASSAVWRPTLDVPLTQETQQHLRATMTMRLAVDAKDIDTLWNQLDRLTLVQGRVQRVSKVGERWFLNFDEDYRRDFTIGIQGIALEHVRAVHGRIQTLEGKNIRVVGIVQGYGGPYMAINNGWQLFAGQ